MDSINSTLNSWAQASVVTYPVASMLLIVALVVITLWMTFKKETFMPTALSSQQQSDTLGMSLQGQQMRDFTPNYGREGADPGPAPTRADSAFAQQTQVAGDMGYGAVDPTAAAGAPGSAAYAILHAPNYACDTRVPIGDDAWGWMGNAANENFKGVTANQLSAISQGQR